VRTYDGVTGRWWAFGGWAAAMCGLGLMYDLGVFEVLHLFTAAFVLAAAATVAFGAVAGHLRDWRLLLVAGVTGTGILVAAAEVGWVATFFVPAPGGSGGVGEIAAPFFIAVAGGLAFLAGMSALLGAGALIGLGARWRQRSAESLSTKGVP
jgi:hypothetical protein